MGCVDIGGTECVPGPSVARESGGSCPPSANQSLGGAGPADSAETFERHTADHLEQFWY